MSSPPMSCPDAAMLIGPTMSMDIEPRNIARLPISCVERRR
jgi:hypothetical protein